jgi:hypothetical protein
MKPGIFSLHFIHKPALPCGANGVITQADRHISFFGFFREPPEQIPPFLAKKGRLAWIGQAETGSAFIANPPAKRNFTVSFGRIFKTR